MKRHITISGLIGCIGICLGTWGFIEGLRYGLSPGLAAAGIALNLIALLGILLPPRRSRLGGLLLVLAAIGIFFLTESVIFTGPLGSASVLLGGGIPPTLGVPALIAAAVLKFLKR